VRTDVVNFQIGEVYVGSAVDLIKRKP
jgi:hypothetical protein